MEKGFCYCFTFTSACSIYKPESAENLWRFLVGYASEEKIIHDNNLLRLTWDNKSYILARLWIPSILDKWYK